MNAFAYALAEWRCWRAERGQGGLLLALLGTAAAVCLSWLGPWLLSVVLPAAALGLGWATGGRYRRGQRFRKLLLGSPAAPAAGAAGKALGSLAEGTFSLLVLAPPAFLSLALWQRGASSAVFLLLSLLATFLLSAAAGFLSSLLLGGGDRLLGLYFFAAWIPASTLVGDLGAFSPFGQAWASLGAQGGPKGAMVFALVIEISLAAALFALGAPAIAAARRHDAEA